MTEPRGAPPFSSTTENVRERYRRTVGRLLLETPREVVQSAMGLSERPPAPSLGGVSLREKLDALITVKAHESLFGEGDQAEMNSARAEHGVLSDLRDELNRLSPPPEERRLVKVAEVFGFAVYSERTAGGGLAYWTDDVGGGQMILDTTVVDVDAVRFIIDNHPRLEALHEALREKEEKGR